MGWRHDGPAMGRMVFTQNPLRMRTEGGMSLKSGDATMAEYMEDAWMREKPKLSPSRDTRMHADNVRSGFLPGRVERKHRKRRK